MDALDLLHQELDAWNGAGRTASFWWRDDDLGDPTPDLDPLLRSAAALGVEPLLAVVPKWATSDLPRRLAGEPARVAVHGWAHLDHEAGQAKKSEFGAARPVADLMNDVKAGRDKLAELFGDELVSCFVPPWNRMMPELAQLLPDFGVTAISAYGKHRTGSDRGSLIWINTHIDVIDWKGSRQFIGVEAMARIITVDLAQRRREKAWSSEPIGLLSHHLEMTIGDWRGFETVCRIMVTHPAARMLPSGDLFERRRDR
jgi:predicted deacetylase